MVVWLLINRFWWSVDIILLSPYPPTHVNYSHPRSQLKIGGYLSSVIYYGFQLCISSSLLLNGKSLYRHCCFYWVILSTFVNRVSSPSPPPRVYDDKNVRIRRHWNYLFCYTPFLGRVSFTESFKSSRHFEGCRDGYQTVTSWWSKTTTIRTNMEWRYRVKYR